MREISSARLKQFFLILLVLPLWMAAERTFQSDIRPLKFAAKRDKESLVALDKLGAELLSRYQQPQEQGEIYYYLAHQHAQGGIHVYSQKVIDYAYKALSYPVTPDQKMRLYIYRGDAFQVLDRKKTFAERRRESVDSYLQGLKDMKSFQLPDKPPDLPQSPPFNVMASTEQQIRENQESQQKYREALDHARFIQRMIRNRDVLQGQIVWLYGSRPLATEELRAAAKNALGEGKELDRLMTAVNDRIAKLPPELATGTPLDQPSPPDPVNRSLRYLLFISPLLAIGGILLVIRLRRRTQRVGGSQ
jgi:hypothetical protein